MNNLTTIRSTTLTILILSLVIQLSQCIRFNLQPHSKRCLRIDIYANQLVVGDYEVSELAETIVDISIKDSKGHTAFNRENISGKGKFAVTTDDADMYDLCFAYSAASTGVQLPSREVYIDVRIGAEAKQYDPIDSEKLSEVERDLNRIDDLTESIIQDFAYLKKREREMRDTNDSTGTRLFYQGVLSIIIVIVLVTWQVLYLRNFFRARKLID